MKKIHSFSKSIHIGQSLSSGSCTQSPGGLSPFTNHGDIDSVLAHPSSNQIATPRVEPEPEPELDVNGEELHGIQEMVPCTEPIATIEELQVSQKLLKHSGMLHLMKGVLNLTNSTGLEILHRKP